MASGPRPLIAGAVALLIVALTLGSAAVTALSAESWQLTAADWAAVRFTVVQSGLSAVASTLLAVPLARAMVRRRFPGRGLFLRLLAAPFLLPTIVAVLALLFSTLELGELVTLFAALPIVHDDVLPPVLPSDHL